VSASGDAAHERTRSPESVRASVAQVPRPLLTARRATAAVGIGGLVLLAAGCARDAPQDTWQPAGTNAQKIQNLQWPVFMIAGIVFILVAAAVGWCVFRYRDRGQPIPRQSHGRPSLEIGLTILPALILIGIAIPTVGTLMALSKTSDTQCYVNVTGQQWWWEMDYPQQPGCGGVDTPIVTSGQMVIPTNTNVLVRGTSRDVIHSFWIPRLNGKRDMVPGRVQTVRIEANQPGIYAGQCTEFCGLSHANMRMEVVALDPADFETWKANQLSDYKPPAADQPVALEGEQTFITQCSRCHQVDGLKDTKGNPVIAKPENYVYSEAAPNLTHLMTRNTFAGASFDLLDKQCRATVWNAPPDQFGKLYLEGVTRDCLNQVDFREWIRNSPDKLPMYTNPADLAATNGKTRGMPYLGLSEAQIDQVVAYLLTRN
jgi:cytochrome c oxidase subunit II